MILVSNPVKVNEVRYKMQYKFDSDLKFNELAYNYETILRTGNPLSHAQVGLQGAYC